MKRIMKLIITIFLFICSLNLYAQNNNLVNYIEHYTDSIITSARQPGLLVSITKGSDIIYEKAKGFANIETKELMDLKMRFRIGSLTKTFTGTVLLQLVDEGKLKLDDPLEKYFPNVPNSKNITIRMLGDMSSGLYNYSESKEMDDSMNNHPRKKWKPQELVDISIKNPVYFEPGKGYHYSNTNTMLLGMIIEKLTGNTLAGEIKIRIIDKLGLTETEFPSDAEFTGYHPEGYNEDDSKFLEPLTDVTTKYDPSWAGAAGAIISSLKDIKIYIKALAEGTLISSEMQSERLKWSLNMPVLKYGFAIFKAGDDFYGHNGSYPGFHNVSVYSPKTKTTIIVLYNSQTNRDPDDLLKAILPMME
jgi:D-alanyl-D-alanine carboxypeptidase